MSTNYYFVDVVEEARRKQFDDDLQVMVNKLSDFVIENGITKEEVMEFNEKVFEICPRPYVSTIHIGQRACGWVALLETHSDLYKTVDEMEIFYKSKPELVIRDEYDRLMSWHDLKEQLLNWSGKSRGKIDEHGYYWQDGNFS